MSDHGEGELQFSTKTKLQDAQGKRTPSGGATGVETFLRDLDGREVLLKENVIFSLQFQGESTHTLLWKVDGTWLGNQQQRAIVGEW